MLNTSKFLDSLSRKGISISLANDRLKITPVDLLTDEIRNGIKEHKAEIMAALSDCAGDMLKEEPQEALQGPRFNAQPPAILPGTRANISPVALSWLLSHRQELKDAGWTGRELYQKNKSKGICWCSLWDEPFLKVYLHDNGVIEFECVIAGKDIIQKARPMHQARKIIRRN
ncbi:MAG: hypothetical protein FD168_1597 [Desulfobulbaceae bacterium]|nr:MAG: hypothetical protein FD168_1597 [Desulfobulbaceae bacterium]